MATYNGSIYIREQVASILVQLSPLDEIVVSDDHSTDNTLQILGEFADKRIKIYINHGAKGVVGNFENALKHSIGEYLFLCDQDDVWLPDKITICLKYLENFMLVVTDCSVTDESLAVTIPSFFEKAKSGKRFWKNIFKNTYLGACVCFRRELLNLVLPIPQSLSVHDEWIGSLADIFYEVYFLPEVCIYYRRHQNTTIYPTLKSNSPLWEKIYSRFYFLYLITGRIIIYFFKIVIKKLYCCN
jgi:glycosyltransferase involved in cell wall biosynthesis